MQPLQWHKVREIFFAESVTRSEPCLTVFLLKFCVISDIDEILENMGPDDGPNEEQGGRTWSAWDR